MCPSSTSSPQQLTLVRNKASKNNSFYRFHSVHTGHSTFWTHTVVSLLSYVATERMKLSHCFFNIASTCQARFSPLGSDRWKLACAFGSALQQLTKGSLSLLKYWIGNTYLMWAKPLLAYDLMGRYYKPTSLSSVYVLTVSPYSIQSYPTLLLQLSWHYFPWLQYPFMCKMTWSPSQTAF